MYLQTYPKADITSIWEAVFIMNELFEEIAIKVGKQLDYSYNLDETQKCLSFMKNIRQLPNDAKRYYKCLSTKCSS